MSRFTPDTPVSELHVEFIEHSPQDIDWGDVDLLETVQVYAAEICDECGGVCVMEDTGSNLHCDWMRDEDDEDDDSETPITDAYDEHILVGANVTPFAYFNYKIEDGEATFVENDDVDEEAPMLDLSEAGVIEEIDGDDVYIRFSEHPDVRFVLSADQCGLYIEVVEDETYKKLKKTSPKDCTNTLYNEGPMMSYRYDIDTRRVGGPRAAAEALASLSLCLVVFPGDDEYLALTGGGMDMSWDICEAYMRLGYLPPAHFIDLPGMAGKSMKDPVDKWVIEGCMRTAEVQMRWAEDRLERLKEYRTRLEKEDERREQRA